jgi:integrase/recombinase XerD
MSQTKQAISPLRQRMIEDMNMRKLATKTQVGYIRAVKKLARFLGHSPDKATAEDLRKFQLHMANNGTSRVSINATITALRFFFETTVGDSSITDKLKSVSVERKLPVVLSRDEVKRLLNVTYSLKYKAAFSVAYGAGLRIQEVCNLKVSDIDGKRKTIRVEQGKGRKDRYAKLSPALHKLLQQWWKQGRAQGKLLKGGWLFPGQNPVNPLSTRQLSRVCKEAVAAAQIDKKASMHSLRHSYATHLLEQKVDIRIIQILLGHSKLDTTARYTQVATNILNEVTSPIDSLDLPLA